MNKRIIAVDFDGTIVKHEEDINCKEFMLLPYADKVIPWICDNFFTILWTCREGQKLQWALDFLTQHNLKFHAINENAPFLSFKTSEKIYADMYIDDKSGIRIDWLAIQNYLSNKFLSNIEEIIVTKILVEDLK